ncbi:hypothetical protein MKW98_017497 [Papaver atlanticum]|uniref:Uncharacterized protein n=1 Tax=Papaver atlanticum TaxID=357466 RepID=A0AAD4TE71_9MAGN|nr:hypothetical protein MKW98_017497 [Papaver atlanticum]
MRKLKLHEQKLLKKTDFLSWKREGGIRKTYVTPKNNNKKITQHGQQAAVLPGKKHVFTKLPRKLLSTDESMNVSNNAGNKPTTEMSEATKKTQGTLSGKRPRNHDIMEGRKGTRQTWVESKAYQYFTMDYTEVRRRRPVHNKFMPLQH